MLKLIRFRLGQSYPRIGLLEKQEILDLSAAGIESTSALLDGPAPAALLSALRPQPLPQYSLEQATLLAPVDGQEVWAAGVTYLRSKKARMEESNFSATAYDRVYEAPRPEIFFKALGSKVSGPGSTVGIRHDARWNVPEPELALLFNSRGELVGFSAGNDMSSRDIEGENLLYLPQAKTYRQSCALGPCVVLGVTEEQVRTWRIQLSILREKRVVFEGETSVGQIKRSFTELGDYLFRCQEFSRGAVLLTGTGIVPPDDFTLAPKDRVRISIGDVGTLENEVITV